MSDKEFVIREDDSYGFHINKKNKTIEVSSNDYFPSKEHLTLIRDWISNLLETEDLEIKTKEYNDRLDKRVREHNKECEEESEKTERVHKIVPGYIYFLQDKSQQVKIGKTKNLNERIFHLGLHLPEKPTLFHHFKTKDITKSERDLHDKFQQYRLNGEWFNLPQEELVKIKESYL